MTIVSAGEPLTTIPTPKAEASLMQLNDKCLQRVFDWLSLEELHLLSQTCQRLHKVAGKNFKKNYPSALIIADMSGIYVGGVRVNGFVEFTETISIFKIEDLVSLPYDLKGFTSLKQINLVRVNLTADSIQSSKEVLIKIEILELIDCNVTGEFDKFLKMCPKLKRLNIRNRERDVIIGTGNQWMLRPHSTLINLKLVHKDGVKINELKTFIIRNRKIRSFATNGNCLWYNWNVLTDANSKFDLLTIDIDYWAKRNITTFCKLLNELHGKGFKSIEHMNLI